MPSLNLTPIDSFYSLAFKTLTLVYIAYRSYAHKSLTNSGILTAIVTGIIHSLPPTNLFLTLIVAFYVSSSKATKYKEEIKSQKTKAPIDKNNLTSSHTQRTHIQVLANSITASFLCLVLVFTNDPYKQKLLTVGMISQYAAVTADTWSSELGILSKSDPFLITNFKTVPPGTNGGVSKAGLISGFIGASIIGALSLFVIEENRILHLIYFSFVGLLGSVIDSILGAYLQASVVDKKDGLVLETLGGAKITKDYLKDPTHEYKTVSGADILSNNGVNILMATITTFTSIAFYALVF